MSVTKQVRHGREWAQRHHPDEPVLVFDDNATSGVDMERAGWVGFAKAVRAGIVTHVWAFDQARVTRAGEATWDEVCAMLTAAGIPHLNTNNQGQVGVLPGNRLPGRMNAVVDQHFREVAIVNTLIGLREIAEAGRPGAATGFGYRRVLDEDKRPALEPHPEQAALVQRMVQEAASGDSLGLIASRLNAEGIPTLQGKLWRRETVKSIVTSPRIVGDRVHQGRVIGPARWPAIVDRDLWLRAQAAIGQPKARAGTRRRYLLTGGMAVCAGCGTALISGSQPYKSVSFPAYQCPHPSRLEGGCGHLSVRAEPLEQHVVEVVTGWVEDPEFARHVERVLAADQADGAPLRAELATVDAALADLAEQKARLDLEEFEYAAQRRVYVERRKPLLAALAALPPEVEVQAADLRDAWTAGGVEDRRALLRVMVEPITVERAPRRPIAERVTITPR